MCCAAEAVYVSSEVVFNVQEWCKYGASDIDAPPQNHGMHGDVPDLSIKLPNLEMSEYLKVTA